MKHKETFEEAGHKVLNYLLPNCKKEMSSLQYTNAISSLKYITQWQAETMYSEEEVLELLRKSHFVAQNIDEWFEENKKK